MHKKSGVALKKLRERFLNPQETNRSNLAGLIDSTLRAMPLPITKYDPYLGKRINDYSKILNKNEEIPQKQQDAKQVLRNAMSYLNGFVRWHSPSVLQNITPPPLLESVAISTIVNLYNPNLMWDYTSGGIQEAERQIVRQLSRLNGWNQRMSDGVFTFGGKGCLMYAVRAGLRRCTTNLASSGLASTKPVVITTQFNHYIIENICAVLNIGSQSCVKVNTLSDETIDLNDLEITMRRLLKEGYSIATIILSGGSTINLNIDPVRKVTVLIDTLVREYKLAYMPFLYFDTVVGWPWLFFSKYDFKKNPLNIKKKIITILKKTTSKLKEVAYADGMGVDFHKMGLTPYSTSAFLVRDASDLHSLFQDKKIRKERNEFGNNFMQFHTLEHSRSAAPVMSAWVALQSMGIEGFQLYIAHLMKIGNIFRDVLPQYGIELINPQSLTFASLYYVAPPQGPYTYKGIMEATPHEIERTTEYTYAFSKYLSKGDKKFDGIDIGFLRTYVKSHCGILHSALRVIPMSPFMSVADARLLARTIGERKRIFDKTKRNASVHVPDVVHK